MSGWLKLHRSILSWGWYSHTPTFRVFLHLLLCANHTDAYSGKRLVRRAQVLVGRKQLAQDLGLSERQIRTALSHLKDTGEITLERTRYCNLVTIQNYDKYQLPNCTSIYSEPSDIFDDTSSDQAYFQNSDSFLHMNANLYVGSNPDVQGHSNTNWSTKRPTCDQPIDQTTDQTSELRATNLECTSAPDVHRAISDVNGRTVPPLVAPTDQPIDQPIDHFLKKLKKEKNINTTPLPPCKTNAKNSEGYTGDGNEEIEQADSSTSGRRKDQPKKTDSPSKDHPQWKAFRSCWDIYPRREGREPAWCEWFRLWENGTLESCHVIREAIETHIAENYNWREVAYVPRMDKWLRGKGWDDEPTPAPAKTSTYADDVARTASAYAESKKRMAYLYAEED